MASGSPDNQDDNADVPANKPIALTPIIRTTISLDEAIAATGTNPTCDKTPDRQGAAPVPFEKSLNVRLGLAAYGILVPVVCLLMMPRDAPGNKWQSGELSAKLAHVLTGECGWPILPFLFFAMVSLSMVIRNETWAFSKPWVRLGIFSGVIVCGYYLLAFSVTVMGGIFTLIGLLIGAIAWLLVVHGSIWFLPTMIYLFDSNAILRGIAIVGGTLLFTITFVSGVLLLPLILILLLSTPLAFLSYLGVSIRIFKLLNWQPSKQPNSHYEQSRQTDIACFDFSMIVLALAPPKCSAADYWRPPLTCASNPPSGFVGLPCERCWAAKLFGWLSNCITCALSLTTIRSTKPSEPFLAAVLAVV